MSQEDLEDRLKKLEELVDYLVIDNKELTERISELEDDHITLLLSNCFCNSDGDNTSCEAIMHYCLCKRLNNRTYNCRSTSHNCVCPYEVIDGVEVINKVKWCREHCGDCNTVEEEYTKNKVIKKFNARTYIRQFLARIRNN